MPDSSASYKKTETTADDKMKLAAEMPAWPGIRIVVAGKPDVLVQLQGLPASLVESIGNLNKPSSQWKSILKDVVPSLTSLAAVFISLAALIYTNHQKNVAETSAKDQREKAADVAKKKILGDLIKDFGNTFGSDTNKADYQLKFQLTAMKLAAYGDRALPAVRMALGADDRGLRTGGILVAQQMYSAETVGRKELTREILGYYTSSPALRLGVLEWLVEMGHQLSEEDSKLAYDLVKSSFGQRGELCAAQDEQVALEAANFLSIWSFRGSKLLVLGMVRECRDKTKPSKFAGARESAINTLPEIAKSLSVEERASLLKDDLPMLRNDVSGSRDLIEAAVARIQRAETVK